MIFRQLFDPQSSTYTYLLADEQTREAVLIDAVFEQFERDRALLRELDLRLLYTLETHVHADHVTAAWRFGETLGSRIVLSKRGGAEGADLYVDAGDELRVGSIVLPVRATPGHTNGCVTYVAFDQGLAFSGNALLIRGAGRTDFQQGDAAALYRSITQQIFTLPDDFLLYPAHDYMIRKPPPPPNRPVRNPTAVAAAPIANTALIPPFEPLAVDAPSSWCASPTRVQLGHAVNMRQDATTMER